jgi:hypothetical protein
MKTAPWPFILLNPAASRIVGDEIAELERRIFAAEARDDDAACLELLRKRTVLQKLQRVIRGPERRPKS